MIAKLKNTERYLKEKGIYSPRAEAEYILCHLLNCDRLDLYTSPTLLNHSQQQDLYELIERRAKGEPLQYILGETQFFGFKFKVQKGVFIPRPETEVLVDTVVNKLKTTNYQLQTNLLDLCTGCGNIAISLTKILPHYKIFASDISEKAVNLAKENARMHNINDNIAFRCGDLFKPWQEGEFLFDIIVCNPPYIKTKSLKELPVDVKNEPREALDGGEDGLKFYRRILEDTPFCLKGNGLIFFEINPDITEDVKYLLNKDFTNIEIIKDYNMLDRVIFAKRYNG